MPKTNRAATTKLEPGEHSIDRSVIVPFGTGLRMRWSIRLMDGRLKKTTTQGRTKDAVRRKAKAKAAEIIASEGSAWKPSDAMARYIETVTVPAIENAKLAPKTKARYRTVTQLLLGRCQVTDCSKHTKALGKYTIAKGARYRAFEDCLQEISRLHGGETAHQAHTVVNKYLAQELTKDEVLESNPLAGMAMDLRSMSRKREGGRKGGVAVSKSDYAEVLDWLLAFEPARGVAIKRGPWSIQAVAAKRKAAVDLALLQATTGLRMAEANQITWDDLDDRGGILHIHVRAETTKTKKARDIAVLDPRVRERMLQRREERGSDSYVIGTPTIPAHIWDNSGRGKATRELYLQMYEELGISLFETERSHVWRATLNSLTRGLVPDADRAAWFGHDEAVNRSNYTDVSDTSLMLNAAKTLLR